MTYKSPLNAPGISRADARILTELQNEGRLSNVELAARVGMSPSPCLRRLKRLEEAGIIEGYAARVSKAALGYSVEAFAQIRLERHSEAETDSFRQAVAGVPEVIACFAVTGDTDYLLRIVARDLEAYGEFLRTRLLNLPNIKDIRTGFVIDTVTPGTVLPVPGGPIGR